MSRNPHSISSVIVRQLYLPHDVAANIERQIDDAIAAAERAAYERARQVATDYWANDIERHGCPSSAGNAVSNVADRIRALIDRPKEPS